MKWRKLKLFLEYNSQNQGKTTDQCYNTINACGKRKYSADKVQIFHSEFHCFITIVSLTVQQLHRQNINPCDWFSGANECSALFFYKNIQADMKQNWRTCPGWESVKNDFIWPVFCVRSINKSKRNIKLWSSRTINSNTKEHFSDWFIEIPDHSTLRTY